MQVLCSFWNRVRIVVWVRSLKPWTKNILRVSVDVLLDLINDQARIQKLHVIRTPVDVRIGMFPLNRNKNVEYESVGICYCLVSQAVASLLTTTSASLLRIIAARVCSFDFRLINETNALVNCLHSASHSQLALS